MDPSISRAATLSDRQAVLVSRLSDGDARIAEAKRAGIDTTGWESFWIGLLSEYERVMDELHGVLLEEYDPAA